jgi:hypothetical protein
VPPGVAARLRTLLPGLNRATLMVGSQTAVLALPPPEESYPSGSSSCSLSLPLRAAAAQGGGIHAPHRGVGEGEEEGSITFELAQPPNASLLHLLERCARLLSRRLAAERQHLAKAQLEVGGGGGGPPGGRAGGIGSAAAPLPCCLLCCCAAQARSMHLHPVPYALSCRAALLPALLQPGLPAACLLLPVDLPAAACRTLSTKRQRLCLAGPPWRAPQAQCC